MILAVSSLDAWLTFVGTLHPAVLHFPIALGIVAAIVELWGAVRRDPGPSSFALTAVWFAAIVAVVTATSGWFNAEFMDHALSLNLFLHRWIGIAAAVLLIVLAISGSIIRARPKTSLSGAWRMALLATAGALGFTGHLGGSMVYGDGYITDALWAAIDQTEKSQRDSAANAAKAQLGIVETPQVANTVSETAVPAPVSPAPVSPAPVVLSAGGKSSVDFTKQIVPILTANCYECHGNGKHKGGVHLDDWKWMTTERKGEWAVKPGDPSASLLLSNIELPESDDSAMPPTGNRVSSADIALIRQWIVQGASPGDAVSPGAVSDNRWSLPERSLTPDELARIQAQTPVMAQFGVTVQPLAQGSSNFEANASLAAPPIGDAQVEKLVSLADFLVVLNLANSAISDLVGSIIVQFQSLRVIRIDHTQAGDQVAERLAGMQKLESINFVATKLTDAGLASLTKLKSLRRLYIWSSQTTPEGSKQFRIARPDVQLIDGQE
ncbi:MAG: hypothetical protein DWH77_00960 [Planctomycetota bacterium]|nr:MAG: hypothetical protein DWH77_00960 [Planctomycetota bacterium]